jgi:hypothetical protein
VGEQRTVTHFQLSGDLFADFSARKPRHWTDSNGVVYFGTLQAIERADGDGRSFTIDIANQSGKVSIHVLTID